MSRAMILACLGIASCGTGAVSSSYTSGPAAFAKVVACVGDIEVNPGNKEHMTYRLGVERSGDTFVVANFNGISVTTFYAAHDTSPEAQVSEVGNQRLVATLPTDTGAIIRCATAESCGNTGGKGLTGWALTCTTTKY